MGRFTRINLVSAGSAGHALRSGSSRRDSAFYGVRSGFTLTELLVVITIIGVLIGLLMPAVMRARSNAARISCVNRQKELGTAILKYESSKQTFPGYYQTFANRGVPWTIMILPEMGRQDLWTDWRINTGSATTPNQPASPGLTGTMPIDAFRCPVDTKSLNCPLSYVVNCGLKDVINNSSQYPPDWAANGVFHNQSTTGTWNVNTSLQVHTSMGDIKDGTQYTILLSENLQAWQWCVYSWLTGTGTNNNGMPTSAANTPETLFGLVWWNPPLATGANSPRMINEDRMGSSFSYSSGSNQYYYARPSSNHDGGVNVTFCDGHVWFMRENISYPVFAQLMTPNGMQAKLPASNNPAIPNNPTYAPWNAAIKDSDL